MIVKRILVALAADARMQRENLALSIEEGKIAGLSTWNESTRHEAGDLDMRDCLLLPGFIDIHVHGGAGSYLMEGTEEAQNIVSGHLAKHGVTGFLPTSVTGPWELEARVLELAHQAMYSQENGRAGAGILGCHLEGPFINPKKKGAQPEAHICKPSIEELMKRVGTHLEGLKIVTIAPEMEGALEVIQFLTANGIIASIGHSNATYEEVGAAIDAGASHVTHCFNAMRPLEGREPGVVGAAFQRAELKAELIWDNIHVHPASCQALIVAKGAEGVILISDGIPAAGLGEGYRFTLGDLPIRVENGSARLPDGTLAGSLLTLDRASHPNRPRSSRLLAALQFAIGETHQPSGQEFGERPRATISLEHLVVKPTRLISIESHLLTVVWVRPIDARTLCLATGHAPLNY